MKTTSRSALTLSHGTSGVWEGTFQVLLSALLADILSDGPVTIELTLDDGSEVSGRLLDYDDDSVMVDSAGGGLRIDRDTILTVVLD
ncbi:hypothetical protein [Ornithinimicrobium murale]|uniref:hypothetical protein n=1 Tax=Ornithinimicrobium murale TaxID=1050153 RepID=UPI000E0CC407|nr:hypothetical protein [Ornithinimicrobium murale]